MNINTRTKTLTRLGAGATAVAITAALTLGAGLAASAQGIAPTAGPDFYAVTAETPLNVSAANGILANDVDPESDPITIWQIWSDTAQLPGENLTANNADGSFTYTPPTGYTGTRVYKYRPTDGTDQGPVVAVTFTITGPVVPPPVNTAPVAVADAYAVTQDIPIHPMAPGLFGNDTDADGNAITISSNGYYVVGGFGESMTIFADGSFFYQPPTGFTGTRVFWYSVTDGTDVSAKADITLTVTAPVTPGNTAPVSVADGYAVTKNVVYSAGAPGILANDTDADGDQMVPDATIPPAGGTLPGESLLLKMDGSFQYVPPTGFAGVRTWSYTASDGTDTGAAADIVFTITPPVEVVANPDSYAVVVDTVLTKPATGFLANDVDANGDTLEYDGMWSPTGGLLPGEKLALATKDGAFSYTPPTGYVGARIFTYTASDGSYSSDPTTLTFTIAAAAPANTAPVAVADSYLVVKDVLFARSAPGVLVNDSDADGDTIMVDGWIAPAGGLLPGEHLAGNINGSFDYTPPTGFTGDRVFTYAIFDGTDLSGAATLTFQVRPRISVDEPDLPTESDGGDSTIPTLAFTGSTPWYGLGLFGVLLAGTGFVLVRNSRREA